MAGLPVKLSNNPGAIRTAPPLLGEHSRAILQKAGFSNDEIASLLADGEISEPATAAGNKEEKA
jgi:crotonobetainyl-CoA:carnitine CoA-transferase CaiB-like acyl-CoA transferase